MKSIVKQIKRVCLIIFICYQTFVLAGCNNERYPMSYYDRDLSPKEKEEIWVAYNDRKFEKQQKHLEKQNALVSDDLNFEYDTNKQAIINETKATTIKDDYIRYEKTLYEDKSSSYYANLSSTKIDDNYRYKIINKDVPDFDLTECDGVPFEKYSELDSLGRCGVAYALLGKETMPLESETRGSIGMIKPSGWQMPQNKYDFIDGKFLYNRCHLIGWQLSAENSNEKNLITGTRYLNTKGMLPCENRVANYIKETNNHVLYRVTPIFEGANLVASRVQIEAMSYEDKGQGLKFNVLLENYEPNIHIDYSTGANWEEKTDTISEFAAVDKAA